MSRKSEIRRCILCAWRVECRKRYLITDGGERCPDFTRDVTLKEGDEEESDKKSLPDLED